jgi:hypothetical protein
MAMFERIVDYCGRIMISLYAHYAGFLAVPILLHLLFRENPFARFISHLRNIVIIIIQVKNPFTVINPFRRKKREQKCNKIRFKKALSDFFSLLHYVEEKEKNALINE